MTWTAVCVLCASRGRATRLEAGHVCAACCQRLVDDLDAILQLAAWASVEPASGRGQGRTVPASRPPINVDGVDPALTLVDLGCGPTPLLDILEAWERMVREERGMARYGPASHARALLAGAAPGDTRVTLSGCVGFLRASVPWWAESPDQPVEDFAAEVRTCRRALSRWNPDRASSGTMVRCPTLTDEGECGCRLYYADTDEQVTCRRCGVTRDAMTLVAVVMADGREVWLDPEAASKWLGVSERTLYRMANRGQVERSHGRYLVRHAGIVS